MYIKLSFYFQFDWLQYLNKFLPVEVDGSEEIVVFSPEYMSDLIKILKKTNKR